MAQAKAQFTSEARPAELAGRINTLIVAYDAVDEAVVSKTDRPDKPALRAMRDRLAAAIVVNEYRIARSAAASLEDAIVQVIMAFADLDVVYSCDGDERAQAAKRRMEWNLYSVLHLLAEKSGTDPAELAGEWYMPIANSPLKN